MKSLFALLPALVLPLSAVPLSGTKTVGPTAADYPSLTAAIADIQANSVGGALLLELQPDYLSHVETFPLLVPTLNGVSAANPLIIRPALGAAALRITSGDPTAATVDLNGARFVTFEGRPGGAGTGKQLVIANTSTSGRALRFINDANGNVLRHLTLESVNSSASSGTVVFSSTTGANGNDNNTLDFCDLRDGQTPPANALYSSGSTGTTAQNNSGNTVSNCNVFNFYSGTSDAAGVRLDGGNTDWSIANNSFYQTVSRAAVAASVRAIHVESPSGVNFTITGNFIGGTEPGAGGAPWTTTGSSAAYRFVGIQLNVGSATPSSVQGNSIKNMVWTSSMDTTTLPGLWCGIYALSGNVNIGTVSGNLMGGGTGTGSISVTTSVTGGTAFGIGSASSGTVAIVGNTIGSITANGSDSTVSASLVGIQVTAGANAIAGNTVGSVTTANSLSAATSSTSATGQRVTGILSSSNTSASIADNTVANLNNPYLGTSTSGQIRGIVTSAGTNTITGNTVRNLSTTSGNPNTTTAASVIGISQSSTVAGQTISRNLVHSLANSSALRASSASVFGIYYAGNTSTGPNLIARNFVHSLAIPATSTSAVMYGMCFNSGTFTVQNNMVRVGLDAGGSSTAGGSAVIGLYDNASTPGRNFYHNSVQVGGMQTSDSQSTYAFRSSGTSNTRYFRNNLFVNTRNSSSSVPKYKHFAVGYGGNAANPAGLTASHNLFLTSGTGGVLGLYGTERSTLAAWQAATGQDASSAVTDPRFVNHEGTVDLHLQAGNPAEGRGLLIAAVTDDFDGQARSGLTPVDIGADAGIFTFIDNIPPVVSYPLLLDSTTANRTLTGWATIVDPVFGPGSGTVSGSPRLYYKRAADADVFLGNTDADNGWKYVAATGGDGTYSFTIDYTLIHGGSVVEGDSIQYFVVAQDAANNLASSPAGATAYANPPVQNLSGKPAAGVNSYRVRTLGGTVTVGPGGSYPSLTGTGGLFAALNSGVLTGDLTVDLTGNTTENGGTVLNAFDFNNSNYPPVANPPYTVTIRPDSATMRTISGAAGSGLIRLNGAQRLTIDGSFGGSGRYLTFRNTSSALSAATVLFTNDASNNTVKNCVLEGAATGGGGLVWFSQGLTTGNDNNAVTGNQIRDRSDTAGVPGTLVLSSGTSDAVANSNNTISNNDLFNFTYAGLYVQSGSASWNITGNRIYQAAPRAASLKGIYFNALGTNTIRGNLVHDLTYDSVGIFIDTQSGQTTVDGNRLWNLGNSSGNLGASGIAFTPAAGQSVTVVNNMVTLSSASTPPLNFYGISDGGTTGSTVVVAHNTVLLTGTTTSAYDSWAFIRSGASNATVKNNLLLNLRSGGGNQFAANFSTASTGSLTIDSNVYAGTGLNNPANFFDAGSGLGGSTPGIPISFAQWQVNLPGDTHSSAGSPGGNYTLAMFVDVLNGNLHLVPTGNVLVNNLGTPVAGVPADCDGDPRSLTTPDIGADELRPPFPQWAQANAVSDDPHSPGANGLANLLNFSFGLNPAAASRNELSHLGNVITPGGLTTQNLSGTATVKFIRRADPVAAGLTYTAQFSGDLANWEADNTLPIVLATDGVNQVVGLNYPLLAGGARARFFRLVVGLP